MSLLQLQDSIDYAHYQLDKLDYLIRLLRDNADDDEKAMELSILDDIRKSACSNLQKSLEILEALKQNQPS